MSVIVSCPKCQKKLKVEDSVLGKNIKCPGCASVFATKAPDGAIAPAPPPAKTAPAAPKKAPPPPDDDDEDDVPRKPAKAAPRADFDDDEDDRPAKKPAAKKPRDEDDEDDDRAAKKPAAKKSRADDDEDDRPKKSAAKKGRASDDDDDEDDRPAKKGKKKGGAGKVLAIVGVIVFLLCGGCGGVGAYIYYKAKEGVEGFAGAFTDAVEKSKTAPELQRLTDKQGPGHPGGDTKKADGGGKPDGGKPDGGKPAEQPKFASEQQLADAMYDDPIKGSTLYGPRLQLTGKVTKVTTAPGNRVGEIFFEPQVEDLMTHQKRPFPINCLFTNPVARTVARVGQTVTVQGTLTGAKASATLIDCVLVAGSGPGPKPDKPGEVLNLKAEDFAQDLNDNQVAAYDRYFGKALQVEGVVARHEMSNGMISAIVFEAQVMDKKSGTKKPFLITCVLTSLLKPDGLFAETVAVGKRASVRGKLNGASYADRTAKLTECYLP